MQDSKFPTNPGEIKIRSLLMLEIIISLFIIASLATGASTNIYNITEYGAIGDGVTLNTKAIQKAIDDCAEKRGGTINFPAGTYLSGTIYLKDHICINLESGAILLGSSKIEDYPLNECRYPSGSDRYVARALIWGEDRHDITITGRGIIDGQGSYFADNLVPRREWLEMVKFFQDTTRYRTQPGYINRPFLIRLVSCSNILIEKVTLQKPAMWLQQYLNCDYVTLRDVTIFSHGSPNNDLIDIDGTRNVVISGCYGDSDDDGITLKSTTGLPVENVTISDCIIRSRTNTIKAGTESSGGFKDITISNCILKASLMDSGYSGRSEGLAGIALEIVDGGVLDRVTISNITIEDMAAPIFLRLGNRARPNRPFETKALVGTFKNVKISNITASNAGRNGCSILGIKGHYIENVSISNVYINFDGGGTKAQAENDYPENDEDYPESIRYGDLPAYGFFCRHVDGLTFRDVEFDFNAPEQRAPLICDDVKNLSLLNFNGKVSNDAPAQMILKNCHDVFISECRPSAMDVLIRLEKKSDQIKVIGNDLNHVKRPFVLDQSIQLSALELAGNLPTNLTLFSVLEPSIERNELGNVTIRSFTTNSHIHYTLDGTEVKAKSKKYSDPFMQVGECLIKAKVFKGDLESSTAILKLPRLQVIEPKIQLAPSLNYQAVTINLSCATPDAEIRYSLDETVPVDDWAVYLEPFMLKSSATLHVQALKEGYRPSERVIFPIENGIQYRYFLGEWEKIPDIFDCMPEKTGMIRQFQLEDIVPRKTNFAVFMTGYISIKKSGSYTFYCGSNDGSKLYINNTLLIDNDGPHGFIELSEDIYLTKGILQIEVHYFQKGGAQRLKVSWSGPGFDKSELSQESFKIF